MGSELLRDTQGFVRISPQIALDRLDAGHQSIEYGLKLAEFAVLSKTLKDEFVPLREDVLSSHAAIWPAFFAAVAPV